MIVEDEPQLLDLAKSMLEKQGYSVLCANKPNEARCLAENHRQPIHLLLADVVMPEMDGKTLRRKIQAVQPGIRTLFMSGYASSYISERGILEQDVNFIQKPFSLSELVKKVQQVLNEPGCG